MIAAIAILAITAATYLMVLNDAAVHQARLAREFDAIPTPPSAIRLTVPSGVVKPFLASWGSSYRTTLQPPAILEFYMRELVSAGWQDGGTRTRAGMATKCFEKEGFQAAVTPLVDVAGGFDLRLNWGSGLCSEAN